MPPLNSQLKYFDFLDNAKEGKKLNTLKKLKTYCTALKELK